DQQALEFVRPIYQAELTRLGEAKKLADNWAHVGKLLAAVDGEIAKRSEGVEEKTKAIVNAAPVHPTPPAWPRGAQPGSDQKDYAARATYLQGTEGLPIEDLLDIKAHLEAKETKSDTDKLV